MNDYLGRKSAGNDCFVLLFEKEKSNNVGATMDILDVAEIHTQRQLTQWRRIYTYTVQRNRGATGAEARVPKPIPSPADKGV